jgi:hypothetical protein
VSADLRKGVSAPVHAVLDVLDKSRGGWARLSREELLVEIELDGPPADVPTLRQAALILFLIERGAR